MASGAATFAWHTVQDFTPSFFMYSGLPLAAVVQSRKPAITIPAGIATFNVRMFCSLDADFRELDPKIRISKNSITRLSRTTTIILMNIAPPAACAPSQVGIGLETAPKVPTGHGAVRAPSCGDSFDIRRAGQSIEAVGFLDGVADAEVAGGEDVGAAEGEDEKHVNRPDADALDLGEPFDDLLVGQVEEIFEADRAVAGVAGEVTDVGGLLGGKAQRTHSCGPQPEDAGGSEFAGGRGSRRQTGENHTRHSAAKLLIHNGLDECLEIGIAELDTIVSYAVDDRGQNRIVTAEVVNGFQHG